MLSERDRQKVRELLSGMVGSVRLDFYTQTLNCEACAPTKQMLDEVVALNDKLSLVEHNVVLDVDAATAAGVERVPTVVVSSGDASRIRFIGMPSGYEFMSLLDAILVTSKGESGLNEKSRERLAAVEQDVHLQVFVTPT